MTDKLKDIYQGLRNYLKKHRKKWAGGFSLKEEMRKIAPALKPHLKQVLSAGPVLVILGIILIIVGIPSLLFRPGIFNWGVIFLFIGIPLATTRLVLKQHIQGNWAHLIEGAQGRKEEIFKDTEYFLKQSGVSSITIRRQELIPGYIRGALGKKREFLVVKDKHFRLRPYQVLVNAEDYGNNLNVAWYLTYRLSIIQALLTVIPFVSFIPRKIEDLDVFDLQDLRAYNTVCHRAVLSAVEKLMRGLGQDVSKIDRHTKGFLGIS